MNTQEKPSQSLFHLVLDWRKKLLSVKVRGRDFVILAALLVAGYVAYTVAREYKSPDAPARQSPPSHSRSP